MPCLQRFALLRHLALPGSVLPVLWPQLTPGHSLFLHSASASLTGPPGVRHNSFAAQPPDLLLRSYVYLSGFGLACTLALRLASYPVSVRRLLGFATPLPPLLPLPAAACGSLHLAVTTRGGTFTRKNRAMPGTQWGEPAISQAPNPFTLMQQALLSSSSQPRDARLQRFYRCHPRPSAVHGCPVGRSSRDPPRESGRRAPRSSGGEQS